MSGLAALVIHTGVAKRDIDPPARPLPHKPRAFNAKKSTISGPPNAQKCFFPSPERSAETLPPGRPPTQNLVFGTKNAPANTKLVFGISSVLCETLMENPQLNPDPCAINWPTHPDDPQGIRVASVFEFSVCLFVCLSVCLSACSLQIF